MHASDIRVMSQSDIETAIESARHEIFNLRFQHVQGQLADTSQKRLVRRRLARLLTVQRERAIWAAYEAETGFEVDMGSGVEKASGTPVEDQMEEEG